MLCLRESSQGLPTKSISEPDILNYFNRLSLTQFEVAPVVIQVHL